MYRRTPILAALAMVLTAAGAAHAQAQPNPNLKPTYGSVRLKAGFLPDPYVKDLVAGGQLRTNLGGVNAFVARAPDFSLHYTRGKYILSFTAKSVGDTTLLINLPDGSWIADDDGGGGLDPLIRLSSPQSGRYDIYVGTYGNNLIEATLHITERDPTRKPTPQPPEPPVPPVPQPQLPGDLPNCYIVSAGVDNYRNANKLRGCLNDARNTAETFRAQTGKLFGKVEVHTLLDGTATRAGIVKKLQDFTKQGAPRDFMVLFLSGHGARTGGNKNWFFLPYDFSPSNVGGTILTDKQILDAGDALVRQKKNFVVIVDACFCGQLHETAKPYLSRHQSANQGGMILMLSSAANQTSSALGNYSAFAKALTDTMAGGGDLNKDGKITVQEIKVASQQRTDQLLAQARVTNPQTTVVSWSPSISRDLTLAHAGVIVAANAKPPRPAETPLRWTGSETLAGYGKLAFEMYPSGRAVMVDARDRMEGVWQQQDEQYVLSFASGAIVYSGTRSGDTISGFATSPAPRQETMRKWKWSVEQQPGG